MSAFRWVGRFHEAFGLPVRTHPTADIPVEEAVLRQALLDEEVDELRVAVGDRDVVGIADALADIVYIACGTAHAYGIDLDAVVAEVHRSNMTKLGADGRPVYRDDGKVLKGPSYESPRVAAVLGLEEDRPA
ncbi:MAG: nucleoside triphosphate pyrophosphohydrolase family protein [Acidimicrobiales bacterium]